MPTKTTITTALLSDTGRVRQNNEDAIGENTDIGLVVLADGMGGYNAGEVASGIAVTKTLEYVQRRWSMRNSGDAGRVAKASPEALLLKSAIEEANREIHTVAQTQTQCAGMGTTIAACIVNGERLSVAHVGDSRVYRLREGRLEQISRDHSLVEEMIARGQYSREEAADAVNKNIVTRALGVEPDVDVDVMDDVLRDGDILLLCSDGLTDMVDDNSIAATLKKYSGHLQEAALHLISQANDAGGKDNVSVIVVSVRIQTISDRPLYQRLMDWI